MQRRKFFHTGLYPLAGLLQRGDLEELLPELISAIPDLETAKLLGQAYMRTHPEEAGLSLAKRLPRRAGSFPKREAVAWFKACVAQELRESDTVIVAGWLLARSEARLCSLTVV